MIKEQHKGGRPRPWGLLLLPALTLCMVLLAGCPPDSTAPGPVTAFTATAGDAQVALAWTNPADSDLNGVRIQRKTGSAPTGATDGTTIFEGAGAQHTDTTAANGTKYYYAAYAFDAVPNYSPGAEASATPTSAHALAEILGSMGELTSEILGTPPNVLTQAQQEQLLAKLGEAELLYRGDALCDAGLKLQEYLALAQGFRSGGAIALAEDLYNQGRTLRYEILMNETNKDTCPSAERLGLESDAAIGMQNSAGLGAAGLFGEPIVQTIQVNPGGKATPEVFTQVHIPGMDAFAGAAGSPAVPVFRRIIAAPQGSEPQVMLSKATPEEAETIEMNLYPAQETPVDQTAIDPQFADKPFVRNGELYASDNPYPPEPVTLTLIGQARDVQLYLLEIAGGQYRPMSNRLTLFKGIDAQVTFSGGTGAFQSEGMTGPFEDATGVLTSGVVNKLAVQNYLSAGTISRIRGEEFMILSHPNFVAAANTLAAWKRTKGISTNVYTCGTGSGITGRTTKEEIDAFIQTHYDTSQIKPSYILLLGDAEFIAPFYIAGIGTDWPYAILGAVGVDTVPDFAVGRIPVDTLDQANTVVNKIIQYEQNPPETASFYAHAAIASHFQCCRTDVSNPGTDQRSFVAVSEFARNVMVNAGKTVDRIYTETGSGTPRRYFDGTLLPAAIGAGSGFAWSGATADITAAINAGRFLVMHRDHGWQEGWSNPPYELPNIDSLTNGALLPVIFSVNCASGFWDNETAGGDYGTTVGGVYFTEKLLRKSNGGAVGILGDSRNSPSWENSTLAQGFFDAIWPNALPTYGDATVHRRLGDILNYGKMYLLSKVGFSVMGAVIDSSSAVSELYLWHCIGDPTLEIWRSNPNRLLPAVLKYRLLLNGVNLEYAQNGATITVFQSGGETGPVPIGRGIVHDGAATLPFLEGVQVGAGGLLFTASLDDAVAKLVTGTAVAQ